MQRAEHGGVEHGDEDADAHLAAHVAIDLRLCLQVDGLRFVGDGGRRLVASEEEGEDEQDVDGVLEHVSRAEARAKPKSAKWERGWARG